MKKTLSVILAVLTVFMCMVPSFAAETTAGGESDVTAYNVSFKAPSALFEGGYMYVKTVNGEIQYVEDEDGLYCFFDNRYMLPSNVLPDYQDQIPPQRYSPVEYKGTVEINEGETVSFKIVTSEKYNVYTASVFINGKVASLNAQDEYTVYVDRDIDISVAEYDENGNPALLLNHFNVKLVSGEGYKLKTLKGENYQVVYYGGDFYFRVKISKGYVASGIKVSVQRGASMFGDFLEEEDTDMLVGIMGGTETLQSYGVDDEGCRLYKIENITTDCRVTVSGVSEESSAGTMSFLKRILKLILDFLGIKIDFLNDMVAVYEVSINNVNDAATYEVISSATEEVSPKLLNVTSGDGIVLVVTKKDINDNVNVSWTNGNELGTYKTEWIIDYNTFTGEVSYSAIYNIDNITADTKIIIS